jgi:hypothetical protein
MQPIAAASQDPLPSRPSHAAPLPPAIRMENPGMVPSNSMPPACDAVVRMAVPREPARLAGGRCVAAGGRRSPSRDQGDEATIATSMP